MLDKTAIRELGGEEKLCYSWSANNNRSKNTCTYGIAFVDHSSPENYQKLDAMTELLVYSLM